MKGLKLVCQAVSRDAAEQALEEVDDKWGGDYPIVIKNWRNKCCELLSILYL